MGNEAVWREVMGSDAAALREFFGALVGARFRGTGRAGGARETGLPVTTVRDLAAAVGLAERLGSRVVVPITRRGGECFAVVAAPDGRTVSLRSPGFGERGAA